MNEPEVRADDLDRGFARDEYPDNGTLLVNAIRWALGSAELINVVGSHGFISQSLYAQGSRQIIHLNNRLEVSKVPGRRNGTVPIGPLKVSLKVPASMTAPGSVELRVAGRRQAARLEKGRLVFEVVCIDDHEVVIVDWA